MSSEHDTAPTERELEAQATRELTELQSKALMASDMALERQVMNGEAPTQEHFAAVTRLNNWRASRGRTRPAAGDGEEREPEVVRTPHRATAPAREDRPTPRRSADDAVPKTEEAYLAKLSRLDMSDPDEREEAKKLRRWAVREHREWIDG